MSYKLDTSAEGASASYTASNTHKIDNRRQQLTSRDTLQKKNPIVVSLHDLPDAKHLLHGLTVLSSAINYSALEPLEDKLPDETTIRMKNLKVSSTMTCSFCKIHFDSVSEQRAHYKLDWHSYNLKQKLKGELAVTLLEFEQIDTEKDEAYTLKLETSSPRRRKPPSAIPVHVTPGGSSRSSRESSPSSTDTEDEGSSTEDEGEMERNPKIILRNGEGMVLALYRSVVYGKKNIPLHDGELIRAVCNLCNNSKWLVILINGGYFAAAVFDGKIPVVHKTLHRYVSRRQRGTAQSTNDNKHGGSSFRSIGGQLRRYNEMSFTQDIQSLFETWSPHLKACQCIFYHATGPNKSILFNGQQPPFKKTDGRIRSVPFQTARASFAEVQRVHQVLSAIECFDDEKTVTPYPYLPRTQIKKSRGNKSGKAKRQDGKENQETQKKSSTKQGEPDGACSLTEDSDEELRWFQEDQEFDTTDLREFDTSHKPRSRHKERRKLPKPQE